MTVPAVVEESTGAKVRVTPMGGDTVVFAHDPERTLREYLTDESLGLTLTTRQSVAVNGKTTTQLDQPVEPWTVVAVAAKIANG